MARGITRKADETWRECVRRYAEPYGLHRECLELFDYAIKNGEPENRAAFDALYDWDCVEYRNWENRS